MHLEKPIITNSGAVYLFASTPDVEDAAGYLRHNTLFSLSSDRRSWEVVLTDPALWCLAGVDADTLVFCSGANNLVWMKQEQFSAPQ